MPETEWVSFCRRTDDPKLRCIEAWLDSLNIPHRRNGYTWHAPLLEVPAELHEAAYELLLTPDAEWGTFDDVPDDDARFNEYRRETDGWMPQQLN